MDKKLTIYTIADSFLPNIGGMEKVAQYSATALGKENNSIIFAPKFKNYTDNLPVQVFRVKSLPIQPPKLMLCLPKLDRKLKKFVKSNPPDIIHVHNQSPLCKWFLKYGKKHNIPTFMTLHGYIENDIDATKFKFLKSILKKYFLKSLKLTPNLFAVSNGNKAYYEQFGFKLTLLRNAIDSLKPDEEYSKEIIKKYNIKKTDNVLCFVNRLLKIKNVYLMIDSFKILKDKNFKFKALIAGDGEEKEALEKLTHKYNLDDCVLFLGNIKERSKVASIYNISSLDLFPSVKDTAGLSIGESASQKTPTLAMENCASSELIENNVNGFLSPNNAESYANRIIEIFKNKENLEKVGENAYKTLYFTWEDYAKNVLEIYKKEIKKQKAH